MLLEQSSFETLVLRFGGLYGYDRHPTHLLAGGTNLENGPAPVSLLHRDDGIGVISSAIQQSVSNGIFNVVSAGHPPRNMYYPAAAEVLGYPAPSFKQEEDNSRDKHKIVSNSKLKHQLGSTLSSQILWIFSGLKDTDYILFSELLKSMNLS